MAAEGACMQLDLMQELLGSAPTHLFGAPAGALRGLRAHGSGGGGGRPLLTGSRGGGALALLDGDGGDGDSYSDSMMDRLAGGGSHKRSKTGYGGGGGSSGGEALRLTDGRSGWGGGGWGGGSDDAPF